MNKPGLHGAWISAFIAFLLSVPSLGQSLHSQHRPFKGAPSVDLPRYATFAAYMQARGNGKTSLKEGATVVGQSALTWQSVERKPLSMGTWKTSNGANGIGIHRLIRASNGTLRWFEGALEPAPEYRIAGKIASAAAYSRAAMSVMQTHRQLLGIDDPASELSIMSIQIDDLGFAHVRFEQMYEDVPIWGRDVYVHFNERGEVYALNGAYEPTPRGIDTTPQIASAGAAQIVIEVLKAQQRWMPIEEETARMLEIDLIESRLGLYPDPEKGMRLAYEVGVHPNLIEWYAYLIDAQTGAILDHIARHCSYHPHRALPPAGSLAVEIPSAHRAAQFVDAQGIDLAGVNQSFRVFALDDGTFLQLSDLDNIAGQTIRIPIPDIGGSVVLTAGNVDLTQQTPLDGITSSNNQWTNSTSVSAHVNAEIVYNYYKSTFGRKAVDDKDQSMVSVIHVTEGGFSMDNAYWNGRFMIYGDGNTNFTPLAESIDAAAHEMTHGVVQHTAGLVYQFQSGALNESFADVFGVMLDSEDFLIGEDVSVPAAGIALRDLLNPNNPQVQVPQPSSMAEYQNLPADRDNGGVHINSGIPNRAAALVIQEIGHDQAAQIYYRALTMYMTRNSQFGDARNALEMASKDLYGDGSIQHQAVQQAFDLVGITSSTGSGGDEGNDIPPQVGGQSFIAILLEDGTVGLVDVTDPNNIVSGTFADATARANAEFSDFTQLTTSRTGEDIWFINDQLQLSFVDVASGEVSVFSDLFLQAEGDLWNASISPDGNFVALVSAYEEDPNLYIFDGQQLATIELKPESSQEGIFVETIQYPDVVSWSPNPAVPRIAFDALNFQQILGGDPEEYWNIYEIDFGVERIYELLPPVGAGLDVGNIAYSNSDPDVVAFNVLADGVVDVWVANFAQGDLLELKVYDQGVTNGLRPSFSPNDQEIVFSNAAANQLVFTDGDNYSAIEFIVPVFVPQWFVFGGSGGSQNQAPNATFSASAITGTAPLQIQFDASESTDPDGDALTYRWDFGDGTTSGAQTVVHTFSQGGDFEVRLTVLDSGGLSSTAVLTIDVAPPSGVPVEFSNELPDRIALHQNYPNPFNPTTNIHFDVPATTHVTMQITDLLGRVVSTLVDDFTPAGYHEIQFDAGDLPSGIYLVRLEAGSVMAVRKIILLR